MKNYVMAGVIALVLLVSIIQSFQINAVKNELAGNAVTSAGETSGETYEEMMARMHPDQAGQAASASGSSGSTPTSPTMVGGC